MAEDNTAPTVSEDDIQDVSLVDTPDVPAQQDEPSAPADDTPETGADTQEEASEQPTTPEAEETPATEPEPAQPSAEERKAIAQREFQNRQRTRSQIAQQLDQAYGPKTEEELVEEGLSRQEAQIQALREEMAFKEQRAQIAEMNASLQSDAVNVISDFSVFNPDSPDFDPEFSKQVETAYRTAARLQTDDNGIVLNAEVPLYDFYKQMNDIYSRGATKGTQQGAQDTLQMLSRTENPGGSSSAGSSGDSLEEMEERLGDVRIT